MGNSILKKEIKQSLDLSECKKFWDIGPSSSSEDVIQEVTSKLNSYFFFLQLQNLSDKEALFLNYLIEHDGSAASVQIIQDKIFEKEEIDGIARRLKSKYLIYIRKSITQIKIVPHSYTLFPEIHKILKETPIYNIDTLFDLKIKKTKQSKNIDFSEQWKKLFYINGGQLSLKDIIEMGLEAELEKHIEEGHCHLALFIHDGIRAIVKIEKQALSSLAPQHEVLEEQSYRLDLLGMIYLIYYHLKTKGIFFTNKKALRKHDFKFLSELFTEEKEFIEWLFEFLEECKLIEISNNQLTAHEVFVQFIKFKTSDKLIYLIDCNDNVSKCFYYIKKMKNQHFQYFDVAQTFFIEQCKDNSYFTLMPEKSNTLSLTSIKNALDTLTKLGVLVTGELGYSISNIGRSLIQNDDIEHPQPEEKGGIVATSDHSLLVYPDKINEYHELLLKMFADPVNEGIVSQYDFNKESIQRAIFLGFTADIIVECLEMNSTAPIPEHVIYNINSWTSKIKKAKVKQITVIEADESIIQLLLYDKNFAGYFRQIGENYLECLNDDLPVIVNSENPIYLIKESEESKNENN